MTTPFRIGDIRSYVSKKNTIEIVKIVDIKKDVIYVQRLNEDFETYESRKIRLNEKSAWRSFIANVDKRSWFAKLIASIR